MFSRVFGVGFFHSLGEMLFRVIGMLFVVMVRVVLFLHPLVPGKGGLLPIYVASISGFLIP